MIQAVSLRGADAFRDGPVHGGLLVLGERMLGVDRETAWSKVDAGAGRCRRSCL